MKTPKLIGLQNFQIRHEINRPVRIEAEFIASPGYDPHHFLTEKWDELFPGVALVKCQYCGQWAARMTNCKSCGGAVE